MQSRSTQSRHFLLILLGLCFLYLGFEVFYNYYATLSVDEFWFAHNVYLFKDHLPYRDFAPYKTVLGYYLLLPPMLLTSGVIAPIILVKNVMAALNTVLLLSIGIWLARYFSRLCVLASLAIIITSEVVLTYSTNFRVDMLGYWFGFFAFICVMENRFLLGGILMGLAFATTQKVLWYIAASNGALGLYWLLYERNLHSLKNICLFNTVLLATIGGYIAFWTYLVDFRTVVNSVFYEAAIMYHLDWYDSARIVFWKALTLNNPLLFLLWPLGLLSIAVSFESDKAYKQRFLIVVFSIIIFACLVPYKQIFPYYFQIAIPVLLVLYAAFFSWVTEIFANSGRLTFFIDKKILCLLLGMYVACLIWFSVLFELPYAYLLICLIPMLLGAYLVHDNSICQSTRMIMFNLLSCAVVIVSGIFPLMLFSIKMVDMNGSYQKANMQMIESLVQDGSDYVAGIELVYNKTQPISGMRHLMGPALDFLTHPTDKLRTVMLPSLNEDPNATVDTVIAALQKSQVKFYVNNYRMMELPQRIKNYLDNEYEHYWGSLYLYAPRIKAAQKKIRIKFPGKYLIESKNCKKIQLNGKFYAVNSSIDLQKGIHQSHCHYNYRLKLLPEETLALKNMDYSQDRWEKMLY